MMLLKRQIEIVKAVVVKQSKTKVFVGDCICLYFGLLFIIDYLFSLSFASCTFAKSKPSSSVASLIN